MNRTLVAATTAAALVASLLIATPALAAVPGGEYPADGPGTAAQTVDSLPILEPALGLGARLEPGVPAPVSLGEGDADAHSALVRLTITRAEADTTVSVAGAPALVVPAGGSASSSVLAPVVDGAIEIVTDRAATVRVERIASFASAAEAPGSVHAVEVPVIRADTANGLGAPEGGLVAGATTQIGLLGAGGVPAEGVRSAFLTLVTETATGAEIELDGQTLVVPSGTTAIGTVVSGDDLGAVSLTVREGGISALTAAITGYVVEAADNPVALQGPGSFVPVTGADAIPVEAESEATDVDLSAPANTATVLALVTDARADALGVLDIAPLPGGRARGVVVDGAAGAAPQIVAIAADSSAVAHGAQVAASLVPIGYIVGGVEDADSSPEITLSSPGTANVDATETWTVNFAGEWATEGDFAQRVEVALDGEPFGSAHLTAAGGWAFDASLRTSGDYRFTFTLVTRGGQRVEVEWQGRVTVPADDDVVITDSTVVLDGAAAILSYEDGAVVFQSDPGLAPADVIVGGVTPATPSGIIAAVTTVDVVDGTWVVTTEPASLTDVFLQADVDSVLPIGEGDAGAVEDIDQSETVDGQPVTDGDPVEIAWTAVDADSLEFDDMPLEAIDDSPIGGGSTGTAASRGGALSPLSAMSPAATFEPASIAQVVEGSFTHGAMSIKAKAQVKLALKVTIDIEVRWTDGSWWPPKPPVPYPWLTEFSTVLESSAQADATASASVSKSVEWSKSKTVSRKFAPITFAVGPVPVVITSEVAVKLEASLSLKGTAQIGVTTSYVRTQQLGFAFKNGSSQVVDPAPKTTVKAPAFTEGSGLSASFSAQAGPTLSFTAKLWDLAGPQIGLSLKAAFDASGSATVTDPFFKASAELAIVGGFYVKLLVTVPVIGKELVNATLLDVSKKWSLWKGEFDLGNITNPGPPAPGDGDSETDYGNGDLTPADDVLDAIEIIGADATSAYFVEGPPHPSAFGIYGDPIGGFPTQGDDYIVMSTGTADRLRGGPATGFPEVRSPRTGTVFDATTLRIDLDIPPGTNCLVGLDFKFYSDEYPDYVGTQFNDAFVAEFGKTSWEIQGSDVYAPRNFAFDELGNPITINAAGAFTINAENAAGTPYGGATSLLRATSPVLSGKTSLFLSIFDQGDSILDSTVLIDRIEFSSVANPAVQCAAGVTGE